jgi:acyl dehydratase
VTKPISQRVFTAADQEAFAELTGDRNPMHMDDAIAKRTQAGACVVHGMHVALWMLDQCVIAGVELESVARIKVQFTKFVSVRPSTGRSLR